MAEVCYIHGKRRLMNDLYIENGNHRCLPNKICRVDGAGSSYHTGGGGMMGGRADAEICAVHGKKRLKADMALDNGQWKCMPHKICRDDNAKCRRHGRLRMITDMDAVGNGEYECRSNKVCFAGVASAGGTGPNVIGSHPVDESLATSGAVTGGQTSVTASMYAPLGGVSGANAGARNTAEVWCHLHGRRIAGHRAIRIDETFNACNDRYACLSSALDPVEVLVNNGCPEVFCSKHGALRAPQYLVVGDRGYTCSDAHPCYGTSSQAMLERARHWE